MEVVGWLVCLFVNSLVGFYVCFCLFVCLFVRSVGWLVCGLLVCRTNKM